jgi:ATP-dependent helicase HrpA
MAGELVETSRLWARQNAAIKSEWAEQLGAHLVKRTYSEPHWSKKRASVMAYERVTLYGVPLVGRPAGGVRQGRRRAVARAVHPARAGVRRVGSSRHRFLETNRRLLEEAEELEHRARRRDIVVDEHTLFDFYDARVGADVVSGAHFDQWWKQERRKRPDLLTFDPAMLTHDTGRQVTEADYPEQWASGDEGLTFPISYHFEPGAADDGLTIDVRSRRSTGSGRRLLVERARAARGAGHLAHPVAAQEPPGLVRAGAEQGARVPRRGAGRRGAAADALERWMRSTTGVVVPREAWDWSKVAPHLLPTYRVVDEGGAEQARGKDLEALKAPLRPQFEQAMEEVASDSRAGADRRDHVDVRDVEESATLTRAGHRVTVFPALVDEGSSVGLGRLRLHGRGRGAAPARRTDGCCCSR